MATTTAAPPGHAAVRAHHLALDLGLHGRDHALGQQGIGAAGLRGADGAGEHAHADQERLLVGDEAGAIERLLEIAAPVELGGDDGGELVSVRQAAEEAGVQHGVEHAPALAQDARQAAAPCP